MGIFSNGVRFLRTSFRYFLFVILRHDLPSNVLSGVPYLLKKDSNTIQTILRWLGIGQIKGPTRNVKIKNLK